MFVPSGPVLSLSSSFPQVECGLRDAEVPLHGRGHSVATGGHFSMLVAAVLSHLSSAIRWCSSQLYILCS